MPEYYIVAGSIGYLIGGFTGTAWLLLGQAALSVVATIALHIWPVRER